MFLCGITDLRKCTSSEFTDTAELVSTGLTLVYTPVGSTGSFLLKQCAALTEDSLGLNVRPSYGREPVSTREPGDLGQASCASHVP